MSQAQRLKTALIEGAVIDKFGLGTPVELIALTLLKQALFNQVFERNEVRISRKCRKGLIRRIAIACRSERQHLPVTLPRRIQEINELICLFRKTSDSVR